MKQKKLSYWLKLILAGIGICGLVLEFWVVPSFGQRLVMDYPEFGFCYIPWLILLWITGIPCYFVLFFSWKLASEFGADHCFSVLNAKRLKWISILAAADVGFFLLMNLVYLVFNMNHPGIVLLVLAAVLLVSAISVVFAVLSDLVMKAAILQEQSDWTI